MTRKYFLVTEQDKRILQDLIDKAKQTPQQRLNPFYFQEDANPRNTYIALTPSTGIPPLIALTPGSATCAIFRLGSTQLESINHDEVVINLNDEYIDPYNLVFITQDKFGTWIVTETFADLSPGTGSGTGTSGSSGGGSGGSSITIKEVDGSPSILATTITVDQADGFSLSEPVAGTARLDILSATTTQAGIVSTAEQNFAGLKRFNTNVYVVPFGSPPSSIIHLGSDPSAGGSYCTITCNYISSSYYILELFTATNSGSKNINLVLQPNSGQIQIGTNHATDYPVITLGRSGSTLTGASGTFTTVDGKTVTVTGGVITSIV